MPGTKIKINDLKISNEHKITLILGPCVIESERHAYDMASEIHDLCHGLGMKVIYKSSFDKANRTSKDGYRGVGIEQGLEILAKIKEHLSIPVLTDVHTPEQCQLAAKYVDVLQIPAFLCRQTDLLLAAGETGLPINVKKGQWMAPENMKYVAEKIASTGNNKIMLCERGSTFGPYNLVNDFTGLDVMKKFNYPICFDATHSVQRQSTDGKTAGNREFVPGLARAATSYGIASLFMEVHDNPPSGPSDSDNMIYLKDLKSILLKVKAIDDIIKS